jgi:hypothetical protein
MLLRKRFLNLKVSSLIYELLIFPPDPTYVVAPVLQTRSGREDMKKLFAGSAPSLREFLLQ